MTFDDERSALRGELSSLNETIREIRAELQELGDDLRQPDEGALAGRIAVEEQALLDRLERRRNEVRRLLGHVAFDDSASRSGFDRVIEPEDDDLKSFDDDPTTVAREGRGEDVDPAVWPEEWTAPGGDQLTEAADVDDPVEALEVGALGAGSEGSPYEDTTELADRSAPAPPEEAALIERVGVSPEPDDLTVGLPPAVDLERLEEAPLDDLIEAELIAMDEGDGESAAIIAAELERRRKVR